MFININGQRFFIESVEDYRYLPLLITDDGLEFYVAENASHAGEATKEYWRDIAKNDGAELVAIIGEQTMIAWALGEMAGPGSIAVSSLDDWIELRAAYPEEQWASYDGLERKAYWFDDDIDEDLVDEIGFFPTVAYRHN